MRKLVYIAVAFLGFVVVSCQKQEIKPVPATQDVPEWNSISENEDDILREDDQNNPSRITDPNNDPEGDGK